MKILLGLLLAAAPCGAVETSTDTLKARVISWDIAEKPATAKAWMGLVEAELDGALAAGADVVLFSELFAWGLAPYKPKGQKSAPHITRLVEKELLPRLAKKLAGKDVLVVLGSYPHQEPGWSHAFNRAPVWSGGKWRFVDKLDPTQQELLEDPPIKAGERLPIFTFRGGRAVVLICYSVEMPEVAARLKAEGVELLLVPSATSDARGVGRVLRTASGRAVELGAAVLVAPLLGKLPDWPNVGVAALFLPDQQGVDRPERESAWREAGRARDDFEIPWSWIKGLKTQGAKPEVRPFLAPTPAFALEAL